MNEYLRRQLEDSRIVELRHHVGTRWHTTYHNALDPLLDAIRDRSNVGNLYTSLNRPDGDHRTALKDTDIAVITRLPFDIDPVRPKGAPSTAAELDAALEARALLVRMLTAYGWPCPALGMSGNGAHALYRVRVKNIPAWKGAVSALYLGLANRLHEPFKELGVRFDTTVQNPARIWRLYGSINRKGDPTEDRPHRRAELTLPAGAWQTVPVTVLRRTRKSVTPVVAPRRNHHRQPVDGRGDYASLDVVAWFQSHDAYRGALPEGKHAVACPWIDEHSTTGTTDTVVWTTSDSGWPTFHCSHDHCHGRALRDVMALWGDADQFCTKEWRHG